MATKKLFAFVHLLHEREYFLDIELFYYKFCLFDSKWYSELEEYLFCPFDFSITHYIHICVVRRLPTQIKIPISDSHNL